jgi:Trypsin-co-occurring domain 2
MIELAEVIRDLRAELEAAIVAGVGERLRLELGPIELEVNVTVERSREAGSKVRFWVAEAGVHAGSDSTGTQRITLTLTPRVGEGAAEVYVSGNALPGEA